MGSSVPGLKSRSTSATQANHLLSKSPSVASVSSSHSAIEELSFNDFMLKYSKNLPLKVRVSKGFLGVSEETAINTDDILKLHFMKHTKVVVMETAERVQLSVPFSSYLKFSVLYDPTNNLAEARQGFKFDTVGDLLAIKGTLPKVIRATRACTTPSPDNCVIQDELLILKQSKKSGKQLKVYSLTAGKRKTLNDSCAGHFTTAPEDIGIHLYEITVHAQECMPCRTILYVRGKESSGVLGDLHDSVVTLKQMATESSVIATSGLCEEGETGDVAEMPADLDIEVEAVAMDEYEQEVLRGDTKYLYELFDPFSVTLYIAKSSKRLYDIQCELYKAVKTELTGLEIMRPHAITLGTKSSAAPLLRSSSSNNSGGYQPLTHRHNPAECMDYYVVMSPNRPVLSEHDSDISGESNASEHLSLLEQHNRNVEDRLARTVDEMHSVRSELARLQTFTEHLRKFCESLQTQIRMMGTRGGGKPLNGIDARGPAALPGEDNYSLLSNPKPPGRSPSPGVTTCTEVAQLTHVEVLKLLDAIGMKQYAEVFQREKINGEVLVDMDDEMMMGDLGIASKLHRMRLMKVIKGEHLAVKQTLKGEDPYVMTCKQESIYAVPRKQSVPASQPSE